LPGCFPRGMFVMSDGLEGSPFSRRVSRSVSEERIVDAVTGEESVLQDVREVAESWDGTIEQISSRGVSKLHCGHVRRRGDPTSVCEACSAEMGRTIHVCGGGCGVTCPGCGKALCLRHTRTAVDGQRYCFKCARRVVAPREEGAGPTGLAGRAVTRCSRLLEWW